MNKIKNFFKKLFTHNCKNHLEPWSTTTHRDHNGYITDRYTEYKCYWCHKYYDRFLNEKK